MFMRNRKKLLNIEKTILANKIEIMFNFNLFILCIV
jgi:hypothetical protein